MNDKMKTAISIIAIACLCACTTTNEQAKIQTPRTAHTAPKFSSKQKELVAFEIAKEVENAILEGQFLNKEGRNEIIAVVSTLTDAQLLKGVRMYSHINKDDVLKATLSHIGKSYPHTIKMPTELRKMLFDFYMKITIQTQMVQRGLAPNIECM